MKIFPGGHASESLVPPADVGDKVGPLGESQLFLIREDSDRGAFGGHGHFLLSCPQGRAGAAPGLCLPHPSLASRPTRSPPTPLPTPQCKCSFRGPDCGGSGRPSCGRQGARAGRGGPGRRAGRGICRAPSWSLRAPAGRLELCCRVPAPQLRRAPSAAGQAPGPPEPRAAPGLPWLTDHGL